MRINRTEEEIKKIEEFREYVAIEITKKMTHLGIGIEYLAKSLHNDMDIALNYAKYFISSTRRGILPACPIISKKSKKDLERLSVLIYGLNFQEDSEIINKIRCFYEGRFIYPPKNKKVDFGDLERNLNLLELQDKEWIAKIVAGLINNYNQEPTKTLK